jgi:hypothetical protein
MMMMMMMVEKIEFTTYGLCRGLRQATVRGMKT